MTGALLGCPAWPCSVQGRQRGGTSVASLVGTGGAARRGGAVRLVRLPRCIAGAGMPRMSISVEFAAKHRRHATGLCAVDRARAPVLGE